jgi:hypothetical protein
MRRHDCFGPGCDARGGLREILITGQQVAVDKDRRRTNLADHIRGGEEALRRGDDLISWSYTRDGQSDLQRSRP